MALEETRAVAALLFSQVRRGAAVLSRHGLLVSRRLWMLLVP